MHGKITLAPCGHTGETIIGNYVKCLMGCDGKPVHPRRGEPGHVANCACKPCQLRRLAVSLVLRTKNGKDYHKLDWDGATDEVTFDAKSSAYVTDYRFLDADGNVVAKGSFQETYVESGRTATIRIKTLLKAASANMLCMDTAITSAPRPSAAPSPAPLSLVTLEAMLLKAFPEVKLLELSVPATGYITVFVKKFQNAFYVNPISAMAVTIDAIRQWLKVYAPVGLKCNVRNDDPFHRLVWVVSDAESLVRAGALSLVDVPNYVKRYIDRYLGTTVASTLVEVSTAQGTVFEIRAFNATFNATFNP